MGASTKIFFPLLYLKLLMFMFKISCLESVTGNRIVTRHDCGVSAHNIGWHHQGLYLQTLHMVPSEKWCEEECEDYHCYSTHHHITVCRGELDSRLI